MRKVACETLGDVIGKGDLKSNSPFFVLRLPHVSQASSPTTIMYKQSALKYCVYFCNFMDRYKFNCNSMTGNIHSITSLKTASL